MAIPPSQIILGFIVLSVVYSVANTLYQRIRRNQKAKALGCLPPNKGPSKLFGYDNFRRSVAAARNSRSLERLYEDFIQYGNNYEQTMLGTKSIVTTEPENIKTILATKFNDFSLGGRHKIFDIFLGSGVFTLDGAGWSHSRAMLRPQFSRDQVADVAVLGGHVNQLISLIPTDGTPVDIQQLFFNLTLDTATEFLFGESTNCLAEGQEGATATAGLLASIGGEKSFAHAFNHCQDFVARRGRAQSLYWLVNDAESRKMVKIVHTVVDGYVDRALARHKQKHTPGEEEKRIDTQSRYVFLDAMVSETQDRKVLRDQMLNILLAGRDTTASLLSSAFFYLARHPRVWKRLSNEIRSTFDPEDDQAEITLERIRDVRYLKYFLNEVLRLQPPVPGNSRWAVVDTTLPVGGGPDGKSPLFIPKGCRVAYLINNMHRRKDFYGEDALEFRPERWAEDGKHGWDYLPFNGGPRICLGRELLLPKPVN